MYRHPLTVATILRARSFKNICFVTDSVAEPIPGKIIRYLDRQCKPISLLLIVISWGLITCIHCKVTLYIRCVYCYKFTLTHTVQVSPSGHTMSLVGSDTIAGSCCTMLDILHNLVQVLDVPVGEAVAMLSENPAR